MSQSNFYCSSNSWRRIDARGYISVKVRPDLVILGGVVVVAVVVAVNEIVVILDSHTFFRVLQYLPPICPTTL